MSDIQEMLAATAERLFAEHCTREVQARAEQGVWPERLWTEVEEAGLTQAAISGGDQRPDLSDAMAILRIAGYHAAPVPLAETMLAVWLAAACGLEPPTGPLTIAPVLSDASLALERRGDGWLLSGTARAVPWGARARAIAALALVDGRPWLALVPAGKFSAAPGRNLAGEPRDDVSFDAVALAADEAAPCPAGIGFEQLWLRGALARATLMAGAMARVLDLTVGYATERVQFGRAIGKFQAVQQQIAMLAGAAAASGAATEAAAAALQSGDGHFAVAAAKSRAGEAATQAAAIAHQVHGAMGFTQEHELHLSTRRLWSWREEFGDESFWWSWLGRQVAGAGSARLWTTIVDSEAARTAAAEGLRA